MTDDPSLPDTLDQDAGTKLVSLAREAITRTVRADGDSTPTPDTTTDALTATRGAFVTVERDERLRGCIGRIEPTAGTPLWRVVAEVAADAAQHDPRCPPVERGELAESTVTVTVLSTPTPVEVADPESYADEIEVGRDGLLVSRGRTRGLLLPQVAIDRDWDAEAFLTATCQKAGLPGGAWRRGGVEIERFTARSFEERTPGGDVVERRFDHTGEDRGSEVSTSDVSRSDDPAGDEPVADGGHPASGERDPAVAGRFYAAASADLDEQIETCLHDEFGPGSLTRTRDPGPTAVVSPHAGYPFSGPVAAHAFAALAASEVETAVVLGPNHEGVGATAAVAPHGRWRTPLGTVPVDGELATALVETSKVATVDERTHAGEHSIEVQVPFLQYCLDDVAIVPVCLTRPGGDRAERLGHDIAAAIERVDRPVAVVSSTDLTHYEPHEQAVSADEPVVDAIEAFDTDAIERAVTDRGHTMCGPWATVAGLTAARELGASDGERLQYTTSGQTGGKRDSVVGYCSVALY